MADTSKIQPHLIVGIGASAGGLEAIEQLVKQLPTKTGMSFVIVQHLSPNFKSLMGELLSRWTDIPIHRVENGMKVEPDHIYLIPPKKEMIISHGTLFLTDKDPNEALTLPIDHFFRSLAQDAGKSAIAIVLSGTGTDGSRGIIDINQLGGLVIAQREDTAKFDGMPLSAIATGICDMQLAPVEIAEALSYYSSNPNREDVIKSFENVSVDNNGLETVFHLIRDAHGIDFSHYKLNTIVRRTERRMLVKRIAHVGEYVDYLKSNPDELEGLYRDLLIGVTRFFRDEEAFDILDKQAIEEIVANTESNEKIRVWVPGCSTGEEAYSIAMLFAEKLAKHNKSTTQVKIFATDVDQEALDFASQAVYRADTLGAMPQTRVEKHFTITENGYQVCPELRSMIVFAPHNILKDPPFTKLDLISCRNLLIYIQPSAQKRILSIFHFGLKTRRFLLLGISETPGELADEFEVESSTKLYRKRRDVRLPADVRLQIAPNLKPLRASGLPSLRGDESFSEQNLLATYDSLLDQFMPSSILVSEGGTIIHTFAGAGRFLNNIPGKFSANILDFVGDDLRIAISTAIRKVAVDQESVTYASVLVEVEDGEDVYCAVTVNPIRDSRSLTKSYLVQLNHVEPPEEIPVITKQLDLSQLPAEQLNALEVELRNTKESLQATIEELETSNEELQATNEELVASNEELQSTNEELHSVNEELYSVNAEHQQKISELSELTRDMDSLLQSTEVHTIFLDNQLRIRKYTPKVAETFNFLPHDVGRTIDSFTHNIACDDIAEKIQTVIQRGEPFEDEVQDVSGCWFLLRILPYSGSQNDTPSRDRPISGALLTLVDVSKLRAVASALEEAIEQRDEFLAMLSHELRNPLGAILNAVNVMSEGKTERREQVTEVVQRQANHMAILLNDLLDVTRVSQGKIRLTKKAIDLREIISEAVESVQPMLNARDQKLEQQIADQALPVEGSHSRLVQVLANLLTNASKYSPGGEVINLSMKAANNEAVVQVVDHGAGIRGDLLERVFEMFAQSQRNLDRSDGGLGVGLTLVKSLIELHGGSVSAKSEGEGLGSEFEFRIPLTNSAPTTPKRIAKVNSTLEQRRIVLVEDNVDAASMLQFLLEDAGFQVTATHDGKTGYNKIKETRPDVAIIDIGLPIMDGYTIAKNIREDEQFASIYLIALTGYGQDSDRELAIQSGFDEHMVKPLDPDLLNKILEKSNEASR